MRLSSRSKVTQLRNDGEPVPVTTSLPPPQTVCTLDCPHPSLPASPACPASQPARTPACPHPGLPSPWPAQHPNLPAPPVCPHPQSAHTPACPALLGIHCSSWVSLHCHFPALFRQGGPPLCSGRSEAWIMAHHGSTAWAASPGLSFPTCQRRC